MAETPHLAFRRCGAAILACALAATGAPALAQGGSSQAVVQPLPPPSLGQLNAALKDLSRDPRNVAALLRAGWASLDLGDTQAALGFFRRAAAVLPTRSSASPRSTAYRAIGVRTASASANRRTASTGSP